jgi:hypothetical protein
MGRSSESSGITLVGIIFASSKVLKATTLTPWLSITRGTTGYGARKVDTALNPGTQSTHFKTPPGLPKSNQALLRKKSSMMLSLLGVYSDEIEKNKQTDTDNKQDDLDATTDRSNSLDDDRDKDRSIDENLRTSALVLLQQR